MSVKLVEKSVYRELNFADPACSCGDYAIDYCKNPPLTVTGRDAPRSPLYQKLFLAACKMLGVQPGDHIRGTLALPLEWAKIDGPIVQKLFARKWQIDGIEFSTTVEVRSQGILAVMNHAMDYDGTVLQPELLEDSVVLDIGGGTTDTAQIKNGSVGNRRDSLPGLGYNQIAERIKQALRQMRIIVSDATARKIVTDRQYKHKGGLVAGIAENIDLFAAELAGGAYSFLTNTVNHESLEQSGGIILTGGAGLECKPHLLKIDQRFLCGEYPVYDNALGGLKAAMRFMKRYPQDIYIGFDIGNSHVKAARWMGNHVIAICFRSVVGERIFEESTS